jgi:hypothetical protein
MGQTGFEPIILVTVWRKLLRALDYTAIMIDLTLFRQYKSVVSMIVFINLTDSKIGDEQV